MSSERDNFQEEEKRGRKRDAMSPLDEPVGKRERAAESSTSTASEALLRELFGESSDEK